MEGISPAHTKVIRPPDRVDGHEKGGLFHALQVYLWGCLAHLALAALRAIRRRFSEVRALARDLPPMAANCWRVMVMDAPYCGDACTQV